MQFKSMKAALAGIAIIGLTFMACKGDDGDAGPAGANGNANVSAMTYTAPSSDWSGGQVTISVPGLTKDIVDNGSVAVFFTFDSLATDTITWNPLPYRFIANVGGQATFVTVANNFSIGQVVVSAVAGNGTGVNFPGETNFRIVSIPSNGRVEGVDMNDYNAVKEVYGIKEFDVSL